jgi:hypothetical protein
MNIAERSCFFRAREADEKATDYRLKIGDGLTRRRGGAENVCEIVITGDHPSGECRATSQRVNFCGYPPRLRASAPPRETSKAPFHFEWL